VAITLFDAFTESLSRHPRTAAPVVSESRKHGKKRTRKSRQEKIFSRCNSQIADCDAFVQENCNDAACVAAVTVCCQLLGECNFTGFIACVNDATAV
jgi:hypothetical protein